MRKFTTRDLSLAAIIAAVYAVLTLILPIPAFTGIQVRLSEALTVLPFLFPATAPGLVVGCFIANLFSPYSLDVIFGTAATLIACILTRHMPNRYLAPLPRFCATRSSWARSAPGTRWEALVPPSGPPTPSTPLPWALVSCWPAISWAACCWPPCLGCPSSGR
mgnify:CR=1 FL=1